MCGKGFLALVATVGGALWLACKWQAPCAVSRCMGGNVGAGLHGPVGVHPDAAALAVLPALRQC
ncbi:MAG: hypothetical protein RBS77_06355 [Candidatus Moranbacteria bacterium]|nr:hypothetical protein [Candidatus Moranbacteria bacterium]